MSDVAATDLVGGTDGNTAARVGAEGALLLDDDDDAVTCGVTRRSDRATKSGGQR